MYALCIKLHSNRRKLYTTEPPHKRIDMASEAENVGQRGLVQVLFANHRLLLVPFHLLPTVLLTDRNLK